MVLSHSSFELFELELDLHDVHVPDSECCRAAEKRRSQPFPSIEVMKTSKAIHLHCDILFSLNHFHYFHHFPFLPGLEAAFGQSVPKDLGLKCVVGNISTFLRFSSIFFSFFFSNKLGDRRRVLQAWVARPSRPNIRPRSWHRRTEKMVCQKKGERICKNAENGWNPTIGGRWVVFGTGTNVFAHCDTCVTCREVFV